MNGFYFVLTSGVVAWFDERDLKLICEPREGEVGYLGTGAGCLKKIIDDLVEVKIHADR